MQRDFETTASTYDSHPEGAYFLCVPFILGSGLGAGDAPVLLLPDHLGLARIGWGGVGQACLHLQVLLGTPLPQEGQDGKESLTGQFMTKTSWFVCLALFLSVLRSPGQ